MKHLLVSLMAAVAAAALMAAGCTQTAPAPTPTKAPAAPAQPAAAPTGALEPTKPAAAPTRAPEATKAPPAQPTAAPTAKVEFPTKGKAISILVGYTAGGSVDLVGRLLATGLETELGTPVQVVNKAGAITQLAMTEVAKARPDGYTLGVATFMPILVTYLDKDRNPAYGRKDFEPVAHFVNDSNVLMIKPDGPYKTTRELVDAARANPEAVKMGATGPLSNTHLMILMVEKAAGVKFATVQFPGAAEMLAALLGGHIDAGVVSASFVVPHHKSGTVRVLAVADKEESPVYPGIKTLTAQGYTAFAPFSNGVVAPAGTPKEIVEILSRATKKLLENEELKKKMLELGVVPAYMDSQRFAAFWSDMEEQVKPFVELGKQQS